MLGNIVYLLNGNKSVPRKLRKVNEALPDEKSILKRTFGWRKRMKIGEWGLGMLTWECRRNDLSNCEWGSDSNHQMANPNTNTWIWSSKFWFSLTGFNNHEPNVPQVIIYIRIRHCTCFIIKSNNGTLLRVETMEWTQMKWLQDDISKETNICIV